MVYIYLGSVSSSSFFAGGFPLLLEEEDEGTRNEKRRRFWAGSASFQFGNWTYDIVQSDPYSWKLPLCCFNFVPLGQLQLDP
jgi:hypothetical protein